MKTSTRRDQLPATTVRVPIIGVLGDDDRVTYFSQVTHQAETPAHLLRPGSVRILDPKAR